jgi:hypothetical protein
MIGDTALVHQPPEVAVRADIVEPVVVNADVREVRRHHSQRALAAKLEKLLVAGGVELQKRGSELEPLRPLRPALRRVPTFHREYRRGRARRAASLDRLDALSRPRPKTLELRKKIGRRQFGVEFDQASSIPSTNEQNLPQRTQRSQRKCKLSGYH